MIGNSQANLGSCNSDLISFSTFKNVETYLNSSKKLQIGFGGRVKLINIPNKLPLKVSASKQPVPVPSEKLSGRKSVNSKPVSFEMLRFSVLLIIVNCSVKR